MEIFRKDYVVRRHGEQRIVKGHATASYEDVVTKLNVQPLSNDDMQALPEGQRATKRLKSFGSLQLTAADQHTKTPGDWLHYKGRWYECVSSIDWDHTPVSHFYSEFVLVTESNLNLTPPQKEVAP